MLYSIRKISSFFFCLVTHNNREMSLTPSPLDANVAILYKKRLLFLDLHKVVCAAYFQTLSIFVQALCLLETPVGFYPSCSLLDSFGHKQEEPHFNFRVEAVCCTATYKLMTWSLGLFKVRSPQCLHSTLQPPYHLRFS